MAKNTTNPAARLKFFEAPSLKLSATIAASRVERQDGDIPREQEQHIQKVVAALHENASFINHIDYVMLDAYKTLDKATVLDITRYLTKDDQCPGFTRRHLLHAALISNPSHIDPDPSDVVRTLVESGAIDVNAFAKPLLESAASQGHLEVVKCLTDEEADLAAGEEATRSTSYREKNQYAIARYLREQGMTVPTGQEVFHNALRSTTGQEILYNALR